MTHMDKIAADYRDQGFAIIRNVIGMDLIEEARNHVAWLINKYPDLRPEHFHHPLIRHDAFWVRLITDDRLVNLAEYFIGPNIACFTAHYICKPSYDGQPVLWHQDAAYWSLEPMNALTIWLAIDTSNSKNGCLRMIPGSHQIPVHSPSLRTDQPNVLFGVHSSLKERAGVKRGFGLRFRGCGGVCRACGTGPVALPFSAQVPVFVRAGWLGQGPGGARPPVAAPEASLTRVPASR